MIFILPFLFGAIRAAVDAVAGAFTAHAAGEKDREEAKHHRKIANELTDKYASLEKKYYEFADESKRQIDDLTRQHALNEVEKDCLRLAIRLQQNLIYLMWEIDGEPTADTLNIFQSAVEQTNQVLSQLKEDLIIVPDDYYARLLTAIKVTPPINTFNPNNDNGKITHINAHYETTISHIDKKTILSIDLGGSFTKACVMCDPENVVFIPSNVKPISVEDIENGVFESRPTDHPLLNLWIEHQGSGYAMGKLAADYGANFGIGQSKLEDALVKVLTVAGYFKLKDEISVVMSLPFFSPQQFESEKAQLINIITGKHFIKFCDSAVDLNISKVWIIPEGYGSFLWLGCQRIKRSGNPDFTKAPLAVVDIGHQNINLLIVDNFKCVRDACKSEEFGMSKFYEIIAAEIKGSDSPLLDLIAVVNKPNRKGLYLPKCANKLTKIDDLLPNFIEQFAHETCSRLFAWLPEKVTDVIITGGGGEFYWEYVQRLLKEANMNTYLAKPSCLANALGQYIYGYSNINN